MSPYNVARLLQSISPSLCKSTPELKVPSIQDTWSCSKGDLSLTSRRFRHFSLLGVGPFPETVFYQKVLAIDGLVFTSVINKGRFHDSACDTIFFGAYWQFLLSMLVPLVLLSKLSPHKERTQPCYCGQPFSTKNILLRNRYIVSASPNFHSGSTVLHSETAVLIMLRWIRGLPSSHEAIVSQQYCPVPTFEVAYLHSSWSEYHPWNDPAFLSQDTSWAPGVAKLSVDKQGKMTAGIFICIRTCSITCEISVPEHHNCTELCVIE